ncbi:DNA glycosylase [Ustulina deusta]|nr:DNA glycosylase [Ustulina deusta]
MDFSRCTDQSPTASSRASDFSNDFMFGFDVEDDDDRVYLAEVAMYGVGHEDDIKHFVRLSLFRGVEEWEQAICCASSMKDRGSFRNSLDGQDVLTFLSTIYGVDGPFHAAGALPPPQRPKHLCVKRKSKQTRVLPDTQTDIPTKKQRTAKNGRNSPYWSEARVPARQRNGHPGKGLEAKGMAKKAPTRRKGSLEGAIPPTSTAPRQQSGDDTVTQAYKGPKLTSISLHESSGGVSFIESSGLASKLGDDDDTREGLPKLDIPTIRVLDTPDPNTESIRTTSGGQEEEEKEKETHKPNQVSDDEDRKPPVLPQNQTPKRKARSPYFETTKAAAAAATSNPCAEELSSSSSKSPKKRRPPRGTISSLPFPRLDAPRFGLIQEELASDPFRLLVAVTFLVRTTGRAAIPVFRALMDRYPTPSALAAAPAPDVIAMIKHLGLGSVRAAAIQRYARLWVAEPPRDGVRHVVRNYHGGCSAEDPRTGDEAGGEIVRAGGGGGGDETTTTTTTAWEIGHMTQGPYALDSWRIFCRDVLRGEAEDWMGGGREGEFQPEWMRVLPRDKELRACLRWMWMREGWQWDPATGEKVVLPEALRRAVQEGRVGYDDTGDLRILDE